MSAKLIALAVVAWAVTEVQARASIMTPFDQDVVIDVSASAQRAPAGAQAPRDTRDVPRPPAEESLPQNQFGLLPDGAHSTSTSTSPTLGGGANNSPLAGASLWIAPDTAMAGWLRGDTSLRLPAPPAVDLLKPPQAT
ncbi:MAG: hypothetical protein DCC67_20250 [Planctomycetota bacterium]|nr:MAG: hypothetical protein DCC67_20250 [Planctomycetota bacterium]